TAIIRFRNNNFANFQTTNLPVINYDLLNNILPTANAGTDQTVAEGELVSLSGSASDSNGDVVSTSWTQTQGTAVTLDNNNTLNPSFQTPSISDDETAIFELTVTDDIGEFSTDSVSINIVAVNDAPVANDDTATVDEGNNVVINVRDNDTDAETATSDLEITNLPATTTNGTLTDNGDGTVSYTHDGSETISDSFTYTVSDDELESAAATVEITVTPVNDPPTITMPDDQNVGVSLPVTLTAQASDIDGTVTDYQWVQTSGTEVILTDEDTLTASFISPIPDFLPNSEELMFTLTVTDNNDAELTTEHKVTVTPVLVADLLPPVVTAGSFFNDPNLETCVSENVDAESYTYVHEFISLDCSDDGNGYGIAGDYTGMDKLPNLKTINFSNNQFSALSSLASLPFLTELYLDNVTSSEIGDTIDISLLSTFTLTHLSMSNAEVAVADLETELDDMVSLEVLNLSSNNIIDISFLSNFTNLKTLILNDNNITSITSSTLSPTLITLNLNNNDNGSVGLDIGEDFPDIANLSSLTTLDLGSNLIATIAVDSLPNSLTTLKLANNIIEDTADIEDLTNLTSLTILDLGANQTSSIGSLATPVLPLEELYINGISLQERSGLDNFVALFEVIDNFTDGYQSLTILNINFTSIDCSTYTQLQNELPNLTIILDGC
ncbi:MAG: tandem-95 repeat protein, partial [Gammaproteobacteria bacterium]|nr:tandem-95 repeat protein [Gammaproteobacteria bacterium]